MKALKKINKILLLTTTIATSLFIFGCEPYYFGVKKEVWDTLNEKQKNKVIEDYNKRETEKQKLKAAIREKELENEKALAPYKTIAKVVEEVVSAQDSKKHHSKTLSYIDTTFNKIRTKNGEKYSVSFSDSSKIRHWKVGDHITTSKNQSSDFYKVNIINLDRSETINGNKES